MRSEWLCRGGGEQELLLFFHGWAMDPEQLRPLAGDGLAVAVFWDYADLTSLFDFAAARREYPKVYLAAWSLGVWAANRSVGLAVDDALALNGTLQPISSEYGIAPEVFSGTIAAWGQEAARLKFFRRVFGPGELPVLKRTPEEQERELRHLEREITTASPAAGPGLFRRAVIGRRDRIFPAAAQRAAWESAGVPVTELELPHDPFAGLSSWRALWELGK